LSQAKEPALVLGAGYKVPQPALKTGHFGKFTVGTLVYIFYAMPRDVLQAHAAQELYAREWRYHRDRKLWFRRESPAGGAGDAAPPPAAPPTYAYWDVTAWEKRAYTGPVAALVQGFLPEDEVKIRRDAPAQAAAAAAAAAQAAAAAAHA
jgi:CCR4-NOT transcription complex subunit 2